MMIWSSMHIKKAVSKAAMNILFQSQLIWNVYTKIIDTEGWRPITQTKLVHLIVKVEITKPPAPLSMN